MHTRGLVYAVSMLIAFEFFFNLWVYGEESGGVEVRVKLRINTPDYHGNKFLISAHITSHLISTHLTPDWEAISKAHSNRSALTETPRNLAIFIISCELGSRGAIVRGLKKERRGEGRGGYHVMSWG